MQQNSTESTWKVDASQFTDGVFNPATPVGPRNLPDSINSDSAPESYVDLFWDDEFWKLLVEETNRRAECMKAANPRNYVARSFTPVSVAEMRAFFGCRVAMELLIYKDRYEQYWREKDSWLMSTPGFGKVFTRDRFLSIWSMLHCINEDDPTVDKCDKIYKKRPVFDHIVKKFSHYYVPECDLSLDEGMIPTKNKLSFKQYIKDKPIKWVI